MNKRITLIGLIQQFTFAEIKIAYAQLDMDIQATRIRDLSEKEAEAVLVELEANKHQRPMKPLKTHKASNNQIILCEDYWDCECLKNYIHPKSQINCLKCGRYSKEAPDSRLNEVQAAGLPYKVAFTFYPASTEPEPNTPILMQNEIGEYEVGWWSDGLRLEYPRGYMVKDVEVDSILCDSWALVHCKRWAYLPKEK